MGAMLEQILSDYEQRAAEKSVMRRRRLRKLTRAGCSAKSMAMRSAARL